LKNTEIAEKLDILVDDVDMIITKIIRSEHKSKVPEIPQKTIL
jgi:NAD+ synthase